MAIDTKMSDAPSRGIWTVASGGLREIRRVGAGGILLLLHHPKKKSSSSSDTPLTLEGGTP